MRVELSCWLPQSPEWIWDRVQKSETLDYVAAPWVRFTPKAGQFPERWTTGKHEASLWLLGVLPLGPQTIGIEYPNDAEAMVLRDNGHGLMAKQWDHWIFVTADGDGTRYTDRVDVSAGLLTPAVALFAWLFYAHRQRRWKVLAASD
jgi:hypothetical protein